MDSGFFVSGVASDMSAQKLNTIAHNLANANTTGYLLDRTAFSTMLAKMNGGEKSSNKLPEAYMTMNRQFVSDDKGIIRKTGNDLDFALSGKGFFQVMGIGHDGVEKPLYTRAGNFHLDGDGSLVTEGGLKVLGTGGNPIVIPRGVVSASEDGVINVDNKQVGKLGIYKINSMKLVSKLSGTVLETASSNVKPAEKGISLHQGMLEGSNVNSVLLMVEMMQNTRSNQSMMKILEQYNQQEGQITQTIGRLPG
ncbi:MAG: flagellar hook basal-body protein [Mariprofundaceae bacterium]|nr:flagellar hook basal-body protein [Mariprofundaceae bacterium]